MATDPRSLTGTRVRPKGRKHIDGGEAPVYEKYQIHSPNGAAEIEESLWPIRLGKRKILDGRTDMERFQSANHQKKR